MCSSLAITAFRAGQASRAGKRENYYEAHDTVASTGHDNSHPLPLPSRCSGMIGWTGSSGCRRLRHDLLAEPRPPAVRTRSTATSTDEVAITREMCLRSGAGCSDALAVDHDAKLTSEVLRALVKGWGSCLIAGSAYHKNTNAKVGQGRHQRHTARLRQRAQGRLGRHVTLAEFASNTAAATLGDNLTPLFIDRGAHPRLQLSPPHDDRTAGESPAHHAQRMRAM